MATREEGKEEIHSQQDPLWCLPDFPRRRYSRPKRLQKINTSLEISTKAASLSLSLSFMVSRSLVHKCPLSTGVDSQKRFHKTSTSIQPHSYVAAGHGLISLVSPTMFTESHKDRRRQLKVTSFKLVFPSHGQPFLLRRSQKPIRESAVTRPLIARSKQQKRIETKITRFHTMLPLRCTRRYPTHTSLSLLICAPRRCKRKRFEVSHIFHTPVSHRIFFSFFYILAYLLPCIRTSFSRQFVCQYTTTVEQKDNYKACPSIGAACRQHVLRNTDL